MYGQAEFDQYTRFGYQPYGYSSAFDMNEMNKMAPQPENEVGTNPQQTAEQEGKKEEEKEK